MNPVAFKEPILAVLATAKILKGNQNYLSSEEEQGKIKYRKRQASIWFVLVISIMGVAWILFASRGSVVTCLFFFLILLSLEKKIETRTIALIIISIPPLVFGASVVMDYYAFVRSSIITASMRVMERATLGQANATDYIIYNWVPINGFGHGKVIWLDFQNFLAFHQ